MSATPTPDILSEDASAMESRPSLRTFTDPAVMTRSPCFHSTVVCDESPARDNEELRRMKRGNHLSTLRNLIVFLSSKDSHSLGRWAVKFYQGLQNRFVGPVPAVPELVLVPELSPLHYGTVDSKPI